MTDACPIAATSDPACRDQQRESQCSARLMAITDRDPRRGALLARRWITSLDGNPSPDERLAIGWALLRWERVAEAMPWLTAASATAGHDGVVMHARFALLSARQMSGEGEGLQRAWHDFATECEQHGHIQWATRARSEQIAHLNLIGRPGTAYTLAQQNALSVAQHGTLADQGRHLQVLGAAAAGCGDFDAARDAIDSALRIFERLGRPVDCARVRFERAWIWQRLELFDDTRAELELLLTVFRRYDLPLRIALCLKDLGTAAGSSGAYADAISYAVQARAMFLSLARHDMVARCDLNLGVVAHYSGLWDLAIAAYRRAYEMFTTHGNMRLALICRRNEALALTAQGNPVQALTVLDEIKRPTDQLGDQVEIAEAQLARARALRDCGAAEQAADHLADAEQRFRRSGAVAAVAECQLERGWMALQAEAHQDAMELLQQSAATLADRPNHVWRALYGLARLAEANREHTQALSYYREALDKIARLRRPLASEHASSAIYMQAAQLCHDAVRLALHMQAAEDLLKLWHQQRALAMKRQMLNAIVPVEVVADREKCRNVLRTLRERNAPSSELDQAMRQYIDMLLRTRHLSHLSMPGDEPFDLAALRERLTSAYGLNWTLLAPVPLDTDLLLVVVTPDSAECACTRFDQKLRHALERACQERFRQLTYQDYPFQSGATSTPWMALRLLADRLLPPIVRSRLHQSHRLLIVPSGPFYALPWSALRLADRWLCEVAILEYLPSLMPQLVSSSMPLTQAPALLLGCSDFGDRAPALPGVRASLDIAQQHWAGSSVRIENAQVSRGTLLAMADGGELQRFGLIHIASHASLNSGYGLLGHIKLNNDDLLVDEILRLNLGQALVVLAACEGSASEVLPGDEALGLNYALHSAGARQVMASLWQVYDAPALMLLYEFYHGVAHGIDPAAALALAQRRLMSHSDAMHEGGIHETPYSWANFVVTSIGVAAHS